MKKQQISRLLTATALGSLTFIGVSAPASAGVLLLEAAQINVARPLVGTQTFTYNALVDVNGNEVVDSFSAFDPFKANGASLNVEFTQAFIDFVNAGDLGVDYNGPLLEFEVSSATELGLYNLDNSLVALANLQITFTDFDTSNTDTEDYAINVVAGQGGAAAPEPGALALLLPALFIGTLASRRRA